MKKKLLSLAMAAILLAALTPVRWLPANAGCTYISPAEASEVIV